MSTCTELTIYKVSKENIRRVTELSLSIISEINKNEQVIIFHEILQRTDNDEELCWYLTWINEAAVQLHTETWADLPSANELMSLVKSKVYVGHFVSVIS